MCKAAYVSYGQVERWCRVKVQIEIDPHIEESTWTLRCAEITPELQHWIQALQQTQGAESKPFLWGEKEGRQYALDLRQVYRIYTEGGEVYAELTEGRYQLSQRLYSLEEQLQHQGFVRLSQSEMVNLRWVESIECQSPGVFCFHLKNTAKAYPSRRYWPAVKQRLGL